MDLGILKITVCESWLTAVGTAFFTVFDEYPSPDNGEEPKLFDRIRLT